MRPSPAGGILGYQLFIRTGRSVVEFTVAQRPCTVSAKQGVASDIAMRLSAIKLERIPALRLTETDTARVVIASILATARVIIIVLRQRMVRLLPAMPALVMKACTVRVTPYQLKTAKVSTRVAVGGYAIFRLSSATATKPTLGRRFSK